MKKMTMAALLSACVAAHAGPTKSSAEAWGQDFRRLRDKSTDALVLRDAVGQSRGAMRGQLDQLAQRGVKLWGEYSACARAAQNLLTTFDETNAVMRGSNHTAVSALARNAFESGQSWSACRDTIDAIR